MAHFTISGFLDLFAVQYYNNIIIAIISSYTSLRNHVTNVPVIIISVYNKETQSQGGEVIREGHTHS